MSPRNTFTSNPTDFEVITQAYNRTWFYATALVIAFIYGLGGVVHLANIFGFGELEWNASPLAWKLGDIWWGSLDMVAVIGVFAKSSIGIFALGLAAATQIVAYTAVPELFAITDAHHRTLEGLVYFNVATLIVLGSCLYVASRQDA